MKPKVRYVLFLMVLFIALISFTACSSPPAEKLKEAKELVKQEIIAEKDLLYDNGENFLVVNSGDWAVAMIVAQQWCKQHPDKQMVFSIPGFGSGSSTPTVYVFYYEDRH